MTTCDRLLLLKPGFEDLAFPGQRFHCRHCALIEGVRLVSGTRGAHGRRAHRFGAAPYHATRGDLLRRLGRSQESRAAYDQAIELTANSAEIASLIHRRDQLVSSG
jgi:hypothetical protein